jgi:hypothetical protein
MKVRKQSVSVSLFIVALLVSFGTFRAFTRGGNDFRVFYEAWRLVLQGRGAEIYHVSPDRYLYGPAFAWVLSPLGLLPGVYALGLWCLMKALALGYLIRALANSFGDGKTSSLTATALGVLVISKPILIDFEYGQVNLFILASAIWALLCHFQEKVSSRTLLTSWAILAFFAVTKLFPIPLLMVPWLVQQGISPKKRYFEKWGIFFGFVAAFSLPLLFLGYSGAIQHLLDWKQALLAKGLPLESHNQSFTALLYHYLSGDPTPVISEGMRPLQFGFKWLSSDQIALVSLAWTFIALGTVLGWIVFADRHAPIQWIAVIIGLLIVPSHLVWKPYFVFSLPLAVYLINRANQNLRKSDFVLLIGLFAGINLTGFDFVGHHWGAHFEAASILLVMHVILLGAVALSGARTQITR